MVWNDASTDNTNKVLLDIGQKNRDNSTPLKVVVYNSLSNVGAAEARWHLLREVKRGIVVQLDLDDYLPDDRVLERILPYYQAGALATSGYYREGEKPVGHIRHYNDAEIAAQSYLKPSVPFCFPPLRTFHSSLLANIKEDAFKWDKKWLRYCTDAALGYALLAQIKNPSQFVRLSEVNYHYRKRDGRLPRTDARAKRRMLENIKGNFRNG